MRVEPDLKSIALLLDLSVFAAQLDPPTNVLVPMAVRMFRQSRPELRDPMPEEAFDAEITRKLDGPK